MPSSVASCSSSALCFWVSFSGTVMFTRTSRSPLPYPLSLGMPLSVSLRISPGCVPGYMEVLRERQETAAQPIIPSAGWTFKTTD